MVRLRARGWMPTQIARHLGINGNNAATLTDRVRDADIEASDDENPEQVAKHYWTRIRALRRVRNTR